MESFSELFEESIKHTEMRAGELVFGTVVHVSKDNVIVSAGLKSEAEIPLWQFKNLRGEYEINIGDKVEVEIEAVEDGYGRTRLSREKACRVRAWEKIEKVFEDQTSIEGLINNRVKGGFSVSLENIRAFLPGSLYGAPVAHDDTEFEFEREPIEFKIIKLDRARNNVVVSRKAVLEKELKAERESLLASIEVGQVVEGIVKNLTDYGAFINLGGIDGLLHITDLSWSRIKHPSELLTVGDKISVAVLNLEKERSRISLGLKQLTADPWSDIERRYKQGDRVFGTVTNIADYGAFVELETGVKGLVHVSEMDWTSKNVRAEEVCKVGEEIEVQVLSVNVERHRISLGIKQCKPNPWLEFAAIHRKDEVITGQVKSLTDFGIFVSLEQGIDGLVHINDVSWSGDGETESRKFHRGDEIKVKILMIDADRERISLGIKQLEDDPFLTFVSTHGKGAVVEGTVENLAEKGVIIKLTDGVSGMIRDAEVARSKPKEAKQAMEPGQDVTSKILSIDRKNRKISLSIKALELENEDLAIEEYGTDKSSPARTLGRKLMESMMGKSESKPKSESEPESK